MWQAVSSSIGSLLLMAFLASFGLTAFSGIFGLYALQKFNAGPEAVGVVMMVFGLVTALVQGLLVELFFSSIASFLDHFSLFGTANDLCGDCSTVWLWVLLR